jgi:hypothetical protein
MEGNSIAICIRNNIKVYPIIHDYNFLKIEINYDGRKKQGKEIYNWRTEQKKIQKKIIELYEIIARNIQNRR